MDANDGSFKPIALRSLLPPIFAFGLVIYDLAVSVRILNADICHFELIGFSLLLPFIRLGFCHLGLLPRSYVSYLISRTSLMSRAVFGLGSFAIFFAPLSVLGIRHLPSTYVLQLWHVHSICHVPSCIHSSSEPALLHHSRGRLPILS